MSSQAQIPPREGKDFSALSVVAVVRNPRTMGATISFLHSQYNLVVVSSLPHLIQALQTHRPKVLLLSWNLKNIDVKRLRQMLIELFRIKCIVFAEDSQKQTTSSLMNSGISQFLLAPVSGANIHSRIQALFNTEIRQKQKIYFNSENNSNPLEKIKKENIPNTLRWRESRDPLDPKKFLWKAEATDTDLGGTYIYKGKRAPQYNEVKKEWNFKESDGSVFFKKEKAQSLGTVQVDEIEDIPDHEFKSRIKKLEVEISVTEEPIPPIESSVAVEIHGRSIESPLAKAVKMSFVKTVEQKTIAIPNDRGLSKITLCSVSCTQYSGYVICASSQNEFHTPYMEKMTAVLQTELKGLGQIILAPLRIFEVEIPPTFFIQWVREKADFYVMSNLTQIALAFFSSALVPIVDQEAESFAVSVRRDLEPEENLDFDLYLHMPKNKKYLHYLKKGQNYSKELYTKFAASTVDMLYVKKEQQGDFFRYLARNFIHATLKDKSKS
jgi:DNA-binding NarL/FixJ family response regulator